MLILLPGRDDREGVADARPVIRAREGEEGARHPRLSSRRGSDSDRELLLVPPLPPSRADLIAFRAYTGISERMMYGSEEECEEGTFCDPRRRIMRARRLPRRLFM